MLVTVNTDASYRHDLKMGAWAFWIKCNNFIEKRSGVFKDSCNSSTDAEFKCVLNALYFAAKKEGVTKIIVNTDNMNVIRSGNRTAKHETLGKITPTVKAHCKVLKNITDYYEVEFRHVKAHVKIQNARDYVNDWCDKAAKKELRNEIKRRENESRISKSMAGSRPV